MATLKDTMDPEPHFEQTVPDLDSQSKKQEESPRTDDTKCTVTASPTNVTASTCANGSGVVSSKRNDNSQACATDCLKGSHSENRSPYVSYVTGDVRDVAKGSRFWSQTSALTPKAPENSSGAGRLPLNTQEHAFNLQFKGKHTTGYISKFSNQKTDHVPYNGYTNRNSNSRFWDHRDQHGKHGRNGESYSWVELKCGPRAKAPPSESSLKQNNLFALSLQRDMYNLPDFQTEYEDAKFFVIKSYSEDDVHKSIKYSVWSSTLNGNKKLDVAFRAAEAKSREDGKKRPIFLFFSVNASRQFVGLAEMVGYVDFDKDLDFWQVDKWCGFFPVQWHVVKDVPNWELRHIILDNNENKPVTHTRDTHEIKLKEGLQMLSIFKNYSAVTSLLDDMEFYEEREKFFRDKKDYKPATLRMDIFKEKDYDYHERESNRRMDENRGYYRRMDEDRGYYQNRSNTKTQSSLVNLTKNLSLRSSSVSKGMFVKKNEGRST